jgi:hypothetical protein
LVLVVPLGYHQTIPEPSPKTSLITGTRSLDLLGISGLLLVSQSHHTRPMSTANWDNDEIQFSRLIVEIESCGAFDYVRHDCTRVIDAVADSMDLNVSQVYELIERATIKINSLRQDRVTI